MAIRAFVACGVLTLATTCAPAQSAAPPPPPLPPAAVAPMPATPASTGPATAAFEVADVHASPFDRNRLIYASEIGNLDGDRYIWREATMTQLVAVAYNQAPPNVQGGPSWLDWDRFNIEAKTSPTASKADIQLMLQSLLKQRFNLVVHTGSAPMPVYVLTAQPGKSKLKESDGTGDSGCKQQPLSGPLTPDVIPQFVLACHNETMEQFVGFLRGAISGPMVFRPGPAPYVKPVIDSTGLTKSYDFEFKVTPYQLLARAGPGGITVFDAVDKQLGLKLALGTEPQPALIVDSVNETPTPNAPDLAMRMPPLPPLQFDVAVIKPSQPDERISHTIRGDREEWHAITMKDHIRNIFDINYNDDASMAGYPKWLGEDRFDILAKIPTDDSQNSTKLPQVQQEEIKQMLRALLGDRLKLKYHWENRPLDAWHLAAANSKLTPADPKARTQCVEGPGPDGKDPRLTNPMLNRLVTCQNVTMEQFGILLQSLGYDESIYTPVADDTGLKGSYSFTLSFTGGGLNTPWGGPRTSATEGPAQASDPGDTLSLASALKNQLGLKLEKEKRPLPVLVIDHVEEPTAN